MDYHCEDEPDDDDRWANYESGPFCEHWDTPWACEIVCARCSVQCCSHGESDHAFENAIP